MYSISACAVTRGHCSSISLNHQPRERDGGREGRKGGGCVELDLSVANLSFPFPVSAKSYSFSRMDGWMELMKANGESIVRVNKGNSGAGFCG